MTAPASRYWGACAEPMVSRQPRGVRTSSRTMAPVRTSAPEAAARAGGGAPRPPARVVNTAGRAGVAGGPRPRESRPPRVKLPAGVAAARRPPRPARHACGRPGPGRAASPRRTVPQTAPRTPRRAAGQPAGPRPPGQTGPPRNPAPTRRRPGAWGPARAPGRPAPVPRPTGARSGPAPRYRRARPGTAGRAARHIVPRLQIRAAVVPGDLRSSPRPAARASPVPSGLRASRASAPTSTRHPATSATDSFPPVCRDPSSTTTRTGSSRRKNAAASPAIPAPMIAITGRSCSGCSTRSP